MKGINTMFNVLFRNNLMTLSLPMIVCLALVVGCSTLTSSNSQTTTQKEVEAVFDDQRPGRGTLSEYQMQDMVMDFADLYVMELWQAYDEIRRSEVSKEIRTAAQYGKVLYTSAAMSIAAGQYPAANLLDMIVHMSLGRYVVEKHWVPQVYGAEGHRLKAVYERLEPRIWQMSEIVLTKEQQDQLRGLIQKWIELNPGQYYVSDIRLSDFVEMGGMHPTAAVREASGLLVDVEKALADVDRALLLSERGMFYLERLPRTMTLQTELMIDQLATTPEVEKLLADANRLTGVSERLVTVAEDLPRQVHAMRQATIAELTSWFESERQKIFDDLKSEEKRLKDVLTEVNQALDTGSELTDKLNATVRMADSLYRLVDASPTSMADYIDVLNRGGAVIDRINALLKQAAPLLGPDGQPLNMAALEDTLNRVENHTQRLMNAAFSLGVYLIAIFLVGLLLVLIAYRHVATRISRSN